MTQQPDISNAIRELRFLPVAEAMFDALADVVFFVKDAQARYVTVNETLVHRCGLAAKRDLLGKTVLELFPSPLGRRYHEQDRHVLDTGTPLRDLLELHLYMRGGSGWCITTKLPLCENSGNVIGIVGVSNDLHMPAAQDGGYRELSEAVNHIRNHIDETLRVEALADRCGLSVYQFEQRMKKAFHLTVGQFISKTRVDAACTILEQKKTPIVDVALACGFTDQSAFTRQFKAATGLTPSEYRRRKQ